MARRARLPHSPPPQNQKTGDTLVGAGLAPPGLCVLSPTIAEPRDYVECGGWAPLSPSNRLYPNPPTRHHVVA